MTLTNPSRRRLLAKIILVLVPSVSLAIGLVVSPADTIRVIACVLLVLSVMGAGMAFLWAIATLAGPK